MPTVAATIPNAAPASAYTTTKKKRPNQLGYLVGIWL